MRDLVDFFPLQLDLTSLLSTFSVDDYDFVIDNDDKAFNFVETELSSDSSSSFLTDLADARNFGNMSIGDVKSCGTPLSSDFLDQLDSSSGIVLVESKKKTTKPLRIVIREKSGSEIGEFEFPVRISQVEKMYRHVDLRQVTKNLNGSSAGGEASSLPTKTGNPGDPYPDDLTNGKYFAFIHGFNVSEEAARGWNAEIFKRLHHQGSKARFIGISWHGDTSPNYHKAVFHAFQTGEQIADALSFANGELTIAAHSLGNVVIGHAISDTGFTPARYYMINAASPIEAYQAKTVTANQQYSMTERDWKDYAAMQRLFAARWFELFDEDDGRSLLSWKYNFVGASRRIYNFYSTGEDVVQNPEVDSASLIANRFEIVRGAWANQEFAKRTEEFPAQLQGPRQAS